MHRAETWREDATTRMAVQNKACQAASAPARGARRDRHRVHPIRAQEQAISDRETALMRRHLPESETFSSRPPPLDRGKRNLRRAANQTPEALRHLQRCLFVTGAQTGARKVPEPRFFFNSRGDPQLSGRCRSNPTPRRCRRPARPIVRLRLIARRASITNLKVTAGISVLACPPTG